ncbi:dicarboxylate transporter 1 chloroplastic [Phtheirospermum japonicum]|uniref:Dicarboxylate transporter 1 chloroplastic n=1 Tax=Phtheirospermum japonicum TaxID=374723 RepID=A0A830CRS7_9LAMI|nr:dicarboxylate transporter 1 chloroplastic [Phtheirospermum japonicum]
MFLTAMAANPLAANLTREHDKYADLGGWIGLRLRSCRVLVSLIVVPLLLYVIYPPTVKSSPDAPKLAKEKLAADGAHVEERNHHGWNSASYGLWIFGSVLSVDAVTAAILGLSVLLVTGVVDMERVFS